MSTIVSKREKEVLYLISYEHNSNQIAQKLFISPHTVISHRKNLMLKLDVKNVAGLVRKAMQLRIVCSFLILFFCSLLTAQQEMELRIDGIVLSRLDHNTIVQPAEGQLVFDTITSSIWYFNGLVWSDLGSSKNRIIDQDGDTQVNVETIPDEDTIRFTVDGKTSLILGPESVEWGNETGVSGINGTAWGNRTKAIGNEATAFGLNAIASGQRSLAWGSSSVASGSRATAHGFETNAAGDDATSWGENTSASGATSSAWGQVTNATGQSSTAWGVFSIASDTSATAWGQGTSASGLNGTAWGRSSVAAGTDATSWGLATIATGSRATTWGDNTLATDLNATAWGEITSATSPNATAWGSGSSASGFAATAWGNSFAQQSLATSWGDRSTASGIESTAWGQQSTASAHVATAWGASTAANGNTSTAWGNATKAEGDLATTWGDETLALSINETVLGQYNDTLTNANPTAWEDMDHLFVIGNGTSNTDRSNALSLLKNGDLAINQLVPEARLDIRDSSHIDHPTIQLVQNDDQFARIHFRNTNVDSNYWATLVRSAADSIPADARYVLNYIDDSDIEFELFANGDLTIGGSLTQNSDVRLKKNISNLKEETKKLSDISGYSYNWKNDQPGSKKQFGMLAQQVQAIYPELVKEKEDGMLAVNYIGFVPLLIEANNDLSLKILKLTSQLERTNEEFNQAVMLIREMQVQIEKMKIQFK